MSRFMKTAVAAVAALVAVQTASAGLVTNILGDRGDGYTLVQISYDGSGDSTGTWSVPVGVSAVEVLVIGGGGAGARGGAFGPTDGSPGGGAGGLYYTTSWSVSGSVSLAVGIGAPTTTSSASGQSGGNSVFGTIIAYGGQGGQKATNQGGNQGGYSIDNGSNITPGVLGGTGNGATGGAGAGGSGRNGNFDPAWGGPGVTNPITGSFGVIGANGNPIVGNYGNMIGYAGGGSAGYDGVLLGAQYGESYGGGSGSEPENNPGTSGFDTLGGGGGGGRGANGGGGGDGVIYIAYQAIPEPATFGMIGAAAAALLLRRRFAKK